MAESSEWEAVVGKEDAAVYRLVVLAVTAMVKGEDYSKLLPKLQKKAEDYLDCMSTVERARLNDVELLEEIYRRFNYNP